MLRPLARLSDILRRFKGGPNGTPDKPMPPLPSRDAARAALGIPHSVRVVVGWAGPVDLRGGVLDLVEAAAICDDRIAVLIPATGPFHRRVLDQADALDLLHRICFVPVPERHGTAAVHPDLQTLPALLAAADVLVVASARRRGSRRSVRAALAAAAAHGLPTILSGTAANRDGPARWTVRAGDPGLLARLLMELVVRPGLLHPAREGVPLAAQPPAPIAVLTPARLVAAPGRPVRIRSPRGFRPGPLASGRAQGNS